jgi:hypothetical protein
MLHKPIECEFTNPSPFASHNPSPVAITDDEPIVKSYPNVLFPADTPHSPGPGFVISSFPLNTKGDTIRSAAIIAVVVIDIFIDYL